MQQLQKILVYVDTSHAAAHTGVAWAAHLATERGGFVTLLDVVAPAPWYLRAEGRDEWEEDERQSRETVLSDLAEPLREKGIRVEVAVRTGKPYLVVIQEAVKEQYDLVVKTMMREDPVGRLFGSVAQRLLRKCPCPVLLVKPLAQPPTGRVVAAVDPHPDDTLQRALNEKVLRHAAAFPRGNTQPILAVHAWSIYGEAMYAARLSPREMDQRFQAAEDRIAQALRELLDAAAEENGPLEAQLVHGDPEEAIPLFLSREKIDLLVIGTMARSGIAGFVVGNTAENILDNVSCSVLAVKPDDFVCPIHLDA